MWRILSAFVVQAVGDANWCQQKKNESERGSRKTRGFDSHRTSFNCTFCFCTNRPYYLIEWGRFLRLILLYVIAKKIYVNCIGVRRAQICLCFALLSDVVMKNCEFLIYLFLHCRINRLLFMLHAAQWIWCVFSPLCFSCGSNFQFQYIYLFKVSYFPGPNRVNILSPKAIRRWAKRLGKQKLIHNTYFYCDYDYDIFRCDERQVFTIYTHTSHVLWKLL